MYIRDFCVIKNKRKMKTRKVEIEIPEGKKAVWKNEVLTLVDDKPQDVTERVKTFVDAMNELGDNHPFVKAWKAIAQTATKENPLIQTYGHDTVAYLKLRIITAALNEGWEPQFATDEWRYFPLFVLYTQEEINEMSEENKSRVVLRSYSVSGTYGGVAYVNAYYDYSNSYSVIGSRLTFKTRDLAEYAGKQFSDIYADFVFNPEEGGLQ